MTPNSRQHPDISVSVKVDLETSLRSRAVLKALIPDNVNLPEGLFLKMFTRGSILWIKVAGENVPAKTIVNTLDEIVEHISVCQKVMPG